MTPFQRPQLFGVRPALGGAASVYPYANRQVDDLAVVITRQNVQPTLAGGGPAFQSVSPLRGGERVWSKAITSGNLSSTPSVSSGTLAFFVVRTATSLIQKVSSSAPPLLGFVRSDGHAGILAFTVNPETNLYGESSFNSLTLVMNYGTGLNADSILVQSRLQPAFPAYIDNTAFPVTNTNSNSLFVVVEILFQP